ncbi:probable NOT transcription complex subunit VIP2 isoform X3 [Elaeis guineensis]|uniref:Probable NOT transcription complex subunit VIP2 isoform X3 n=1 Tax=Elaeis guineensis var. tenera TaxID=51953 RepID=A0A6I9R7Z9_ELAGV|nr:probable NOT transcription complex subunit VIP2 isoform X3 [Elaeis guineensis]
MSGLLNSTLNGSTSNLPDSTGRPFTSSFSAQAATTPGFHHSGLHNIHGSFNIPNMPSSLASRNVAMSGVPSSGVQQPGGNISGGRFTSNSIPVALSQISHGSGVSSRGAINVVGSPAFSSSMSGVGGSIPGISSSSATAGNRSSVPGLGVSPILGNVGPRITSSMGNMVGGGSMGRSISSGGLSVPGLASRVNLAANSGAGNLNVPGPNRLMGGMLQQAAPQMLGMLGNSYPTSGGPLLQSQIQGGNNALSSMGMLNDVNSNDSSPFDMNDFPQLTGRPSSAGGPQGQLGSMRKQGVGVNSIVQQTQEFSIQNEDFPALPGFKGGSSDYSVDLHQKEQLQENVPMMQSPHFSMARSSGFSLGGTYPSNRQQQQQHAAAVSSAGVTYSPGNNQDLIHLHGSDLFPSSHGTYHSQMQNSGPPSIGLRSLSSTNAASGMGAYEQIIQQYQHPHNQSQFRLQQMSAVNQSYRDQSLKSMQGIQTAPDRFGLLGLLSVIRMNDPDLTSLALGIDLTTLGLNLNSSDNLHKTFGSPWSDEPARGEPEYCIPSCYYAKQPPPLQQGYFSRFNVLTLFYIFYSMPKDEAQLYAASELCSRGWFYHKEHQLWFTRANVEPLVKTQTYERGTYVCFDPNTWETRTKENFVLQYEAVDKKPTLPSARP